MFLPHLLQLSWSPFTRHSLEEEASTAQGKTRRVGVVVVDTVGGARFKLAALPLF